jgi:predicted PurR-regulated permease PerM
MHRLSGGSAQHSPRTRRPTRLAFLVSSRQPAADPAGKDRMDTSLEQRAFLLLLAIVTVAFFWLLIPFYGAVFWAVILAIIFQPLQLSFERRWGQRSNRAALLSMLVCIFIAIIPMALVSGALVNEGAKLVQRIQNGAFDTSTLVRDFQGMLPQWAQTRLEQLGIGDDLEAMRSRLMDALQQIGQLLAAQALNLGQNTLRFIASVGIMLYLLFFLFRDGRKIGRTIRDSMPLTPEYNRALLGRFAAVVRATVKGNIVIALIQGTIGGVTFWALGIEGALLWGAMMVLMSLLPAVGAAVIWVPAAAYFFLNGEGARGIILTAVGIGVIGLVDNLLRPVLVGKDTRMPDYVILIATVGGLSIFGINGFVIGPLIAALFISVWTIFREDRQRQRDAVAVPR